MPPNYFCASAFAGPHRAAWAQSTAPAPLPVTQVFHVARGRTRAPGPVERAAQAVAGEMPKANARLRRTMSSTCRNRPKPLTGRCSGLVSASALRLFPTHQGYREPK